MIIDISNIYEVNIYKINAIEYILMIIINNIFSDNFIIV